MIDKYQEHRVLDITTLQKVVNEFKHFRIDQNTNREIGISPSTTWQLIDCIFELRGVDLRLDDLFPTINPMVDELESRSVSQPKT